MRRERPDGARWTRRSILVLAGLAGLAALAPAPRADSWGTLEFLGRKVAPGAKARLSFLAESSFLKDSLDIPVLVVRGVHAGPTLCVTAAVHGDELNGVEIARRAFEQSDPATLSGTLVVLPIVNIWGFRSGNRYLPDRRDLNRVFPGRPDGSTASRVAYAVFSQVIRRCDALVDLHTGSAQRTNLPQIRADLSDPLAAALAAHFDVGIVLDGGGPTGTLRRAALDAGIPAVLYEAGEPLRFQQEEIARGYEGVRNVMEQLEMVGEDPPPPDPQRTFRRTSWLRAPAGGIFLTDAVLGQAVHAGSVLGHVTDPLTDVRVEVAAPEDGTLIGMAVPQVVLPGYGLFHVARRGQGATSVSETE